MKLKDKKGLTLVEMLCTVAILVLVSMVMVLGVQLGVRSYAKSVSYSEAQVLCSTLTTTISDELRYSGTLKVDGSGNVTGFFSQQFGSGDYTAFTTTPEGHVQLGGKALDLTGAVRPQTVDHTPALQYLTEASQRLFILERNDDLFHSASLPPTGYPWEVSTQ